MFESQPQSTVETHAPADLEILSGTTKASMKRYEENQSSASGQYQTHKELGDLPESGITSATRKQLAEAAQKGNESGRGPEDLEEIRGGIASSQKEAFERGTVSNVEKKKEDEGDENLPTTGIASKTRASIESGHVIRAEDRHVRETDIIHDMATTGAATAARRKFESKSSDEEKAERRLSYQPAKGEAKSRAAMYMQSVEHSSHKNLTQDEEDALPPAGKAKGVRQMFEEDKVIHAEANRQDSWREELPASGVAHATKEALKVAASKGFERTQIEEDALSPGKASETRNRYERGEFEQRVIDKEEPVVSPGSTKEQLKQYQEAAQDHGVRRRTMDNEQEELQAARGVALSVRSSYEKEGAPHIETKRTIASEDFTGVQGRAKETTREIEEGAFIKETPKMVDSEDFGVTEGHAKGTTQQIEKGELLKEAPKLVDEEDFSGISGVVKETRSRIDSEDHIKEDPVGDDDKEDLSDPVLPPCDA